MHSPRVNRPISQSLGKKFSGFSNFMAYTYPVFVVVRYNLLLNSGQWVAKKYLGILRSLSENRMWYDIFPKLVFQQPARDAGGMYLRDGTRAKRKTPGVRESLEPTHQPQALPVHSHMATKPCATFRPKANEILVFLSPIAISNPKLSTRFQTIYLLMLGQK